jgi:PRTRC genetic system ParB family protein
MKTAIFQTIPLDKLVPNDYNSRRFSEMTARRRARFEELVDSIHHKGILEPLLVRPIDGDCYEVIAGERRYRAALQVVTKNELSPEAYLVPCMVHDIDADSAFDMMVIENLQREDLTAFELASSFQDYLQRHGNTAEAVNELSFRTGIPAHGIRRQVRLLNLPPEVLAAWKEGTITQSHAELFTRVADRDQTIELLIACQRNKLSTRELAERIGAAAPDLERGFFDKTECQTCHFNTTVQSGLFTDLTPAGKCGNSACFEEKQGQFLTENWSKSKPAVQFGTRGFIFGHLPNARHESLGSNDTADRCLGCDAFVSMLRLTGAVVSMYERTCTGPRKCYDELYRDQPAELPASEQVEKQEEAQQPAQQEEKTQQSPAALPAANKKKKPASPTEETGPVWNPARGARFREIFYRSAIPAAVQETAADQLPNLRLSLLALGLASSAAKAHIIAGLGLQKDAINKEIARLICQIPLTDLPGWITGAALAQILAPEIGADVRHLVGKNFGIDVNEDWILTEEYLQSLTPSEIVRVGEEDGMDLFNISHIKEYREKHFKGKALRSLKKQDLIDMIIKSGPELAGYVPAEIIYKAEA